VPTERSTNTTLVTLRERGELVEFVVGIDRGHETRPGVRSWPISRFTAATRGWSLKDELGVAASPALVEAGRYEHLLALIAFVYHLALPMDRRHNVTSGNRHRELHQVIRDPELIGDGGATARRLPCLSRPSTPTEPGCAAISRPALRRSRSALLNARSSGTSPAPICVSTA